jgi:hypothetical protein
MDKQHADTHAHESEGRREQAGELLSDRLMQEINILRLEGALFCFDPREAKRRSGTVATDVVHGELGKHSIAIEAHPKYGQPSVLAYKVMQAIFLKLAAYGCQLTDDGRCLYTDRVAFTFRELAQICGRSWGGKTAREIERAIMQLQTTLVRCSFYNKDTEEWAAVQFYVTPRTLLSGRGSELHACVIEIDRTIINSINKKHFAFFNLHRLNTLDTIGVVLYKRIFFHFSNLNQKHTPHDKLKFEKDYEDICREWLGGLKPHRHKSLILRDQLGRHLEALKRTHLIRKFEIARKASGTGFKLVVWAGQGFFDDYRDYYLKSQQPRPALAQLAGIRDIQQPLELVAEFHRALSHSHQRFEEKETAYAAELLKELSEAEVRDLIEYAVEDARKTGFAERMRWFGALRNYLERWGADRGRRTARRRKAAAIAACAFCNEQGYLPLTDAKGCLALHPCPHDVERISALEEGRGLRRV